jgi:hypothetical protein
MKFGFYILLVVTLSSCNQAKEEKPGNEQTPEVRDIKFDETKWRVKKDQDYPHRDEMLDDLIESGKLKGLKSDEVLDLLGQPDRTDTSYLFYQVAQKRMGFMVLHTKTLVVKLDEDSTVQWVKIHQ